MKRIILSTAFTGLIVVLTAFTISTGNTNSKKTESVISTDYDEGWEDGFCEGWKDVKGQNAICPITPIAPIPKISCGEGYRCGYNRGFKYGMCKAKGHDCTK